MNQINPNEDYAHTLRLLVNMGFSDMERNRKACRQCNGLLHEAIEILGKAEVPERKVPVRSEETSNYTFPKLSQIEAEKVLQCASMGFNDEGKIRHALELARWQVEDAIEKLVEDNGVLDRYSWS